MPPPCFLSPLDGAKTYGRTRYVARLLGDDPKAEARAEDGARTHVTRLESVAVVAGVLAALACAGAIFRFVPLYFTGQRNDPAIAMDWHE